MRPAGWPDVTAVIATRGGRPAHLERAVASILAQDYPGRIEVIVVVDGPSPVNPSPGWPGEWSEPSPPAGARRVRIAHNARRPGLAGARNTGVMATTAELVAFCDDDDEWLQGKLRAQANLLADHPETSVVATGVRLEWDAVTIDRVPPAGAIGFVDLLRSRVQEVHPSSFLFRRAMLLECGLVDETLPGSYGEDYELLLRAARTSAILVVPRPLVLVRWHQTSYFASQWKTMIAAIERLLALYPEFQGEPQGLARLQGRSAFAHAALGDRRQAARLALRCLRTNIREARGYVALMVASRLLSADRALRFAHARGRGI